MLIPPSETYQASIADGQCARQALSVHEHPDAEATMLPAPARAPSAAEQTMTRTVCVADPGARTKRLVPMLFTFDRRYDVWTADWASLAALLSPGQPTWDRDTKMLFWDTDVSYEVSCGARAVYAHVPESDWSTVFEGTRALPTGFRRPLLGPLLVVKYRIGADVHADEFGEPVDIGLDDELVRAMTFTPPSRTRQLLCAADDADEEVTSVARQMGFAVVNLGRGTGR